MINGFAMGALYLVQLTRKIVSTSSVAGEGKNYKTGTNSDEISTENFGRLYPYLYLPVSHTFITALEGY
jgi:hypothetical protein